MKTKFFSIAILGIGFPIFVSCSTDDDNSDETLIDAQELPEKAQGFITTYFPDTDYSRIEMNTVAENDGTLFEVDLTNNFEIDFSAEGDWVDVDGNGQEIPSDFIPETIAEYIAANYADLFITGIDSEPNGYEVDLSNNQDVKFDLEGNFVSEEK